MRSLRLWAVVWMCCMAALKSVAQELYVYTDPASNMPAKSIGVRLTLMGHLDEGRNSRIAPELMLGLHKNLMVHASGFLSDMDGNYQMEGAALSAKYRFLSMDEFQSHFRAAAYGKVSYSKRPLYSEDLNLEGDHSGWQGGFVFTQLIHKLALSATVGYSQRLGTQEPAFNGVKLPEEMVNFSLSSGYLLFPIVYTNYKEPNFNVYAEVLGKTNPESGHTYVDMAPALQIILNSRTRIDLGYRFQITGNMPGRVQKNMYLLRAEFNFFNALSKKNH